MLEDEIFRFKGELESIFGKRVSMRDASRAYAKVHQKQIIIIKENKKRRGDISDFLW
jgi:hypothetical protein